MYVYLMHITYLFSFIAIFSYIGSKHSQRNHEGRWMLDFVIRETRDLFNYCHLKPW